MVVSGGPPQIVASTEEEVGAAARKAARLDLDRLLSRPDSHLARADSLPWLTGSPEGRAFLGAKGARALARGAPADQCPAAAAVGDQPTPTEATSRALSACLVALPAERREGCGCRLIAVDGLLTVQRSEVGYATGVSARLTVEGLGIDAILVAEDVPGGGGALPDGSTILLRDLRGDVARITPLGSGRAALVFADTGQRFEGRREPVGYRRGRLAERFYLRDADGNRAVLLIGFSPAELAEHAGAGLAWPKDG